MTSIQELYEKHEDVLSPEQKLLVNSAITTPNTRTQINITTEGVKVQVDQYGAGRVLVIS